MKSPAPARHTMHVLVVEDDKISRIVLRRILESIGDLEVYEAEDGQTAWELLDRGLSPDFCFLDLNTPRLNGLELLKRIRSDHRLAPLKVCICSVVRDRETIMRAATLQPDYYLLKPYSRSAIETQINRARAALGVTKSLDPVEAVCTRLGINQETYLMLVSALIEKTNTLLTRIPGFLIQADAHGACVALEDAKRAAQNLGAHRVLELVDGILSTITANSALLEQPAACKEEMAANMQQWMYLSSGHVLPALRELRAELQALERLAEELANPQLADKGAPDAMRRRRADMDALANYLSDVFKKGKLLANGKIPRSKSLDIPVRASTVGEQQEKTVGTLTQKLSFTMKILDEETAEAIEECRRTADLVKWLSYPAGESERWIPDDASRLLAAEIKARNEQGARLLREAIGGDLNAFLSKQEPVIRENLNQLYRQFRKDGQAPEEQVSAILQEVRERFQPVLDGQLTPEPTWGSRELGELNILADDEKWATPYSLLRSAALLFRTTGMDAASDRLFRFMTFERRSLLQAMNIFDDVLAESPDPVRAGLERQEIEAIDNSPATLAEKSLMVWSLIKEVSDRASKADSVSPNEDSGSRSALRPLSHSG